MQKSHFPPHPGAIIGIGETLSTSKTLKGNRRQESPTALHGLGKPCAEQQAPPLEKVCPSAIAAAAHSS